MAFTVALIHGHGFILGQKEGMMIRIMFSNAIYQKVCVSHHESLLTM